MVVQPCNVTFSCVCVIYEQVTYEHFREIKTK
jgi:hypothetical protein